jgi:hypothetical protein
MKSNEVKSLKTSPSVALSPATLTFQDLKVLKSPFPKERLGVKVQSFNKERTRAMLVLYLQHTDVQDRLEEVDPTWTIEALREEAVGDTVYLSMRMTLKGVSRENVGEGGDPKAAYSDAIKRCAMLFGIGRYLYDLGMVWADYNEQRDRFKNWTIEDYEQAARGRSTVPGPTAFTPTENPSPAPENSAAEKPGIPGLKTSASGGKPQRSREQLNRLLMNLYRPYLSKFPDTRFVELLQGRYGVGETRLMSLEQIGDLIQYMEKQMESAASA